MGVAGYIRASVHVCTPESGPCCKTAGVVVKEAIEAQALAAGVISARPRRTPEEIERRVKEIAERVAALPILDTRSDDEILGYNEHGVWN